MASKLWNVLVIIYYISYLFLIIIPLSLYFLITNSYRRNRNKRTVRKILKNGELPKELQKDIRKSYKSMLNSFKILNFIKNNKTFKISKNEDDKVNFSNIFKFTTS